MTLLDTTLTQWVTPALRPRGWRKNGRRIYHYGTTDLAAYSIVKAGESGPGRISFYVEIGPITAAAAAWGKFMWPRSRTDTEPGTLWSHRIIAPEPVEQPDPWNQPSQFGTHTWMIDLTDPGSPARCGQILAHTLLGWAPTAESWTDRPTLAAFLSAKKNEYGLEHWRNTGLVIVDDGPSPLLDRVIAVARSKDDTRFADWLETRSHEHRSTLTDRVDEETEPPTPT